MRRRFLRGGAAERGGCAAAGGGRLVWEQAAGVVVSRVSAGGPCHGQLAQATRRQPLHPVQRLFLFPAVQVSFVRFSACSALLVVIVEEAGLVVVLVLLRLRVIAEARFGGCRTQRGPNMLSTATPVRWACGAGAPGWGLGS